METEAEIDLEKEILVARVLVETANSVVVAADLAVIAGNLENQKCMMLLAANAASHAKCLLDQVVAEKFSAAIVLKTKSTTVQ